MGAPLDNERRTSAFSANQQGKPQGMVLPWLMTMPSPNEAMDIGTRPDQKRDPEGRSRATQLMPMPDGPGSASPAFPTNGEDATASWSQAPWLRTTLLPGDNISETRDPAETYIALKRLLRIAEHEGGNSHAAPESSAENLRESSGACATEITPLPGLQLKEEIANIEIGPHPAETYVAPEADVAISAEHEGGNSCAAPECATQKSEGVSDGSDELGLLPRANHPMPDDAIASVAQANQLERDWIRAVSAVPNADSFQGGVDESDLAVPTQGSKTSTRIILVACIFTASVLCIWNTGLKPFPDFPNATEMASPAASVSSKQGLEGMRAPDVEADAWMTPISPTPARPELDRESVSQLQPDRQDVQPQRITDTPHVAFLPLPQGVPQSTGAKGGITAESRAEPGITKPTCYASASAVSQDHPKAWPSWTLRALGHEGTKCWYPTTRTLAHDHPK